MQREENDLLTQTGPGTPCGELMRLYWQPVALSEELPSGGAPIPVKLFGEDYVLFRDDQNRPGLLDIHCSHRGADLSYGRVENGGLRCIYHGWLYDIEGRCLDQPCEAGGGAQRESIRHPAYPCLERSGAIFAYLGPGRPPEFPSYQFLNAPEDSTFAVKLFSECNYLQGNEGNIDLGHLSFLHYNQQNSTRYGREDHQERLNPRGAAAEMESYDAELTGYGVRSYKILKNAKPGQYHLYVTEFVLPNLTTFGGRGYELGGYSVNWHVPIDDTHHWKFTFMYSTVASMDRDRLRQGRASMTADYKPIRNRANRYLQTRDSMKNETYSGMALIFQVQDLCVTEGMGPIMDRTKEHLTSVDLPIVAARKVMLNAIRELREGREPVNVVRDPNRDRLVLVTCDDFVPESVPWKEYIRNKYSVS